MAAAKAVEVMVEAMAKAVEIVLLNRIMHPFDLSRSPGRTRFNVEVDEVDVVRGLIEYWRRDPGLPLVLLVVTRSPSGGPAALLERWELRYAARPHIGPRRHSAARPPVGALASPRARAAQRRRRRRQRHGPQRRAPRGSRRVVEQPRRARAARAPRARPAPRRAARAAVL